MSEKFNAKAREVADKYAERKGLKLDHESRPAFDEARAKKIAKAFDKLKHDPKDPKVIKAYTAFIKETEDQYHHIKHHGLKVTPILPDMKNPYPDSAAMVRDVKENNHLYYYPTDQGFGSGEINDHPLLKKTSEHVNGKPLLANDMFRIVHDYFGHAKEGNGFGPKGEEQAWHSHMPMYSPEAQKALTTETRGQNSWVNFGPYGEQNRKDPTNTKYAEQKAGILPDEAFETTPEIKKFAEGGMPMANASATPQSLTGQPGHAIASAANAVPASDMPGTSLVPANDLPGSPQEISPESTQPGEQFKAGAEGALRGFLGPVGSYIEKNIYRVPEEDINRRRSDFPGTSAVGEGAGLIGGALTGTGEAAALEGIGKGAAEIAGLTNPATTAAKIGSSIVRNAAEGAAYTSQDEFGKMLLDDPDYSAQTALANIGVGTALGGGVGLLTGAANPLWQATLGPRTTELLDAIKSGVNKGSKVPVGPELDQAVQTIGKQLDPLVQSTLSGVPGAAEAFSDLRRGENKHALDVLENLHRDLSESVMEPMGLTPEDITAGVGNNAEGKAERDALQKEIKDKFGPIEQEIQQRNAEAFPLRVPDDERLAHAGRLVEQGINTVKTDSEHFPLFQKYAEKLLNRDTIGEIDGLKTEINNDIRAAIRADDQNKANALRDIRNSLGDFQESQIERMAQLKDQEMLAKQRILGQPRVNVGAIDSAIPDAQALITRRAQANANYRKYADTLDTMMDHFGLGNFKGTGTLLSKLTDHLTPEQLRNKLSIANNADLIPFLQEHFPETLQKIIEHERKDLIRPAILSADKKGKFPIDINKLHDIIGKKADQPEFLRAVLPRRVIDRVQAAKKIMQAIPAPRDSGTPAGISKILRWMAPNAMSAISWATGHGVIGGLIAGETMQRLGKDAPEAAKLAWLRFLGSDAPTSANGFKAAVDYFDAARKGARQMSKASSAVFIPGSSVLATSQLPKPEVLAKLDRLVASSDPKSDNRLMQTAENGHLGHYFPEHQTKFTQASLQVKQYLSKLKPNSVTLGPLDKQMPPDRMQELRYQKALNIAAQPNLIYQKIKDGTLQATDIQDLDGMYPAMRQQMAQKLTNDMINHTSVGGTIPYKTRMAISLFLGQPMDMSMQPTSIQAAQATYQKPQSPQQGQQQGKTKKGTTTLGKSNNSYKTVTQEAEADRSSRD